MITAGVLVTGADIAAARLTKSGMLLELAVDGVTRTYTHLLVEEIKQNASGRPGPEIVTGQYHDSWTADFTYEDGTLVGDAFTNEPQANRLEHGFHGVDSIGRAYDQPPYPHVLPAVLVITPRYEAALLATVGAIL